MASSIRDSLTKLALKIASHDSSVRYKTLDPMNVTQLVEDSISSIDSLIVCLETLTNDQQIELHSKVIKAIELNKVNNIDNKTKSFILHISKNLKGVAAGLGFIPALLKTLKQNKTSLESVRGIIKYVVTEKIVINDLQMTHILLLSIVNSAIVMTKFTQYIITIYTHILNPESNVTTPKFITHYIETVGKTCIDMINEFSNSSANIKIEELINKIKQEGADYKLLSQDQSNAEPISVVVGGLAMQIIVAVKIALCLFVLYLTFKMLLNMADYIVTINHSFRSMQGDIKAWMENHVAVLRMNLANMDPNSPEYIKTVEAIKYYDDKIAQYNQQLEKYYGQSE